MTIEPGKYDIPHGYIVKVLPGGRHLWIKPRHKHTLAPDDYRCRDCVHQVKGYTGVTSYRPTKVCELRPKRLKTPTRTLQAVFYAAHNLDHICKRFQLRAEL